LAVCWRDWILSTVSCVRRIANTDMVKGILFALIVVRSQFLSRNQEAGFFQRENVLSHRFARVRVQSRSAWKLRLPGSVTKIGTLSYLSGKQDFLHISVSRYGDAGNCGENPIPQLHGNRYRPGSRTADAWFNPRRFPHLRVTRRRWTNSVYGPGSRPDLALQREFAVDRDAQVSGRAEAFMRSITRIWNEIASSTPQFARSQRPLPAGIQLGVRFFLEPLSSRRPMSQHHTEFRGEVRSQKSEETKDARTLTSISDL